MNRLQKKCLMATAGFHLLLLVILFVGPAFFSASSKPDDSKVLDVIPANIVENAVNSGVRGATPPPSAPAMTPPAPTPPTPQIVTPPASVPAPEKMEKAEPVKPKETAKLDLKPVKPAPEKADKADAKPQQLALKPTVRTVPKNSPQTTATDDSAQRQAQALKRAAQALRNNLSSSTTVDMPGDSSAAYANYASVVKSIYTQAWNTPDDADNDDANVKVSVTIASDGTVIAARMVTPSGDAKLDNSIQRTLDRVTFIRPFPTGSTDKQRTYIITFNLKAKRMLG